MTAIHEHDYDLSKKVKISFKGMDYFVMPRYRDHYLNHEYERFSLQILKNNLHSKSLFVDIGAHYGAYSLYAAKQSLSKVYAIEPVIENLALLNMNVKANDLSDLIETFDYAASDKNGEAEFNIPWASDSAGFYAHPNAETIRSQKVITRKVDDIIDGQRVDVIKIDTEGHEIGVLKGLKKSLRNNPNAQLIIEINPPLLESAGTSARALLELVRGLDKEIYMIDEDRFTMHRITDRLDEWPRYINEGNYANLYCVPAKGHQYAMFVSHSSQLGGAEKAMIEQIVELRKNGIFSHVVLPGRGPIEEILIANGISHTAVGDYSFWIDQAEAKIDSKLLQERNFNNINAAIEIADVAATINPTIVINNSIVNPWGYPTAQLEGLPLVWMVHEYGDLDHNLPFSHGIDKTRDFVLQASDLVICCSDAVRGTLSRGRTSLANVRTVYNFLRSEEVIAAAKVDIKPPFKKTVRLSIIGSLSEGKGQARVIDAVALLKKRGIDVELLIIGGGNSDYTRQLKRRVKGLGLEEDVIFTGFKKNPYPYIRASDAVIVASRNEAFGRVTAEAMILRVPVIAANTGGSLEMVEDKKTGFLFDAASDKELATAVIAVINLRPKERQKIVDAAEKNILALLDTDKNAKFLSKLLNSLRVDKHSAAMKKIIFTEYSDAVRVYSRRFEEAKHELELATARYENQEKINLDLLREINSIRSSKGYRVARKLSAASKLLRRGKRKD